MSQVYSPHTAVDAVPGGLGDWLADIVTGTLPAPEPATKTATSETASLNSDAGPAGPSSDALVEKDEEEKTPKGLRPRMGLQRTYSRPTYPDRTEASQTDLTPYGFLPVKRS